MTIPFARWCFVVLMLSIQFAGVTGAQDEMLALNMRRRVEVEPGCGRWHSVTEPISWKASETCIVVCDMWDDHWCKPSSQRVAEMAPR